MRVPTASELKRWFVLVLPMVVGSVCAAKNVVRRGRPKAPVGASVRWSAHQCDGRRISAEKEALIEKALQERLSQRAIARSLSAGRETVRRVLKKSLAPAA